MKICTFIGNRDVPQEMSFTLKNMITNLILNEGVTKFYVGNHGGFDYMVQKVLSEIVYDFPNIEYNIVLAYIPKNKNDYEDYSNTIYPHGLECVPPKFAVVERNRWMIRESNFLICYVRNNFSNASQFKEFAQKHKKRVIEL